MLRVMKQHMQGEKMTYKLEINQTLFLDNEEEARELGQTLNRLTRPFKSHGALRLSQRTERGFREVEIYKPARVRATSMRQESHTTVLAIIKELSHRADTQLDVSRVSENVVVLPEGQNVYTIDYKAFYNNFVNALEDPSEVEEAPNTFTDSVSTVYLEQSLRGIKEIKL